MKISNTARLLDFGLAAGCLAYGLYAHSLPWVFGGLLGLVLAFVNPGMRIKKFLLHRFHRKNETMAAPPAGFPPPPSTPYERRSSARCAGE